MSTPNLSLVQALCDIKLAMSWKSTYLMDHHITNMVTCSYNGDISRLYLNKISFDDLFIYIEGKMHKSQIVTKQIFVNLFAEVSKQRTRSKANMIRFLQFMVLLGILDQVYNFKMCGFENLFLGLKQARDIEYVASLFKRHDLIELFELLHNSWAETFDSLVSISERSAKHLRKAGIVPETFGDFFLTFLAEGGDCKSVMGFFLNCIPNSLKFLGSLPLELAINTFTRYLYKGKLSSIFLDPVDELQEAHHMIVRRSHRTNKEQERDFRASHFKSSHYEDVELFLELFTPPEVDFNTLKSYMPNQLFEEFDNMLKDGEISVIFDDVCVCTATKQTITSGFIIQEALLCVWDVPLTFLQSVVISIDVPLFELYKQILLLCSEDTTAGVEIRIQIRTESGIFWYLVRKMTRFRKDFHRPAGSLERIGRCAKNISILLPASLMRTLP